MTKKNESALPPRAIPRLGLIYTGLTFLGLGGLLAMAGWLRWQYVLHVSPNVDEFTTLWVVHRTIETGTPNMPSGVFYPSGLLSTYITAAFMAVGGESYAISRLPSVLFGLAAVVAIFVIARREWNLRVAWLAAVGLALLPEAVIWSGRVRFYAQLLLFVLLMIWAAFEAVVPERQAKPISSKARPFLLFVIFFILALFAQEETILLFPSLVLAMWLWRGWRFLWQPAVLLANLSCIAAMGLRFLIEEVGQPGYFATMQEQKPYTNLIADAPVVWSNINRLFIDPERLPWTVAGLLALTVALVQMGRHRGQLLSLSRFHQATLFFALQLVGVLLVLHFVIGAGWSDPRYLFMLQPVWLLVGMAGAVWLVERLTPGEPARWLLTGALAGMAVLSFWPAALRATQRDTDGYDAALAYVAQQRQQGDIIMSAQPPACALVMRQPCDYYARELDFEPYSIERNGVMVDRWTGARVLASAEELANIIKSAPRVWFVVDYDRLGARYNLDFLTTLVDEFHQVYSVRNVAVLVAEGWRNRPTPTISKTLISPLSLGGLTLTGWSRNEAVPGEQLYMLLYWLNSGELRHQVNTSLQVVAADGTHITQKDGPPFGGFTTLKDYTSTPVPDVKKLILPATMAPGRYRIDTVVYQVDPFELLAEPATVDWFHIGEPPAAPQVMVNVGWQNGLILSGHDRLPAELQPGEKLPLRLVWNTATPVAENYTIFVQLLGPDGAIIAQADHPPEGGFYPTSGWHVGEPIEDIVQLQLPATLASGDYRLIVGFYRPDTFERPPLSNGGDAAELGHWTLP